MTDNSNHYCPQSEDFFYWPPEEIAKYKNWCDTGNEQHKRRLKKVCSNEKIIKTKIYG